MIYGYARCSTNEERQDIDRQKRELYSLGVTEDKYIYWEYESGTKTDTFTVFFFENKCVIFTMDKANGETKTPEPPSPFSFAKEYRQ